MGFQLSKEANEEKWGDDIVRNCLGEVIAVS
jgi:hypothetical protein